MTSNNKSIIFPAPHRKGNSRKGNRSSKDHQDSNRQHVEARKKGFDEEEGRRASRKKEAAQGNEEEERGGKDQAKGGEAGEEAS